MTDAQYLASRGLLWSGVSALFTDGRGRVLLEDVTYRPVCLLPGGAVDADEAPSAAITREVHEELGLARREAWEEARVRLSEPFYLGYLDDDTGNRRCARARYAAAIAGWEPPTLDEATGQMYARLLAAPEQAAQLFDWGAEAASQLAAVHTAREKLGLPTPAWQPLTELPPAPSPRPPRLSSTAQADTGG
ncbi:NUDIX domain-containing protein, partial [Streptomyces sp. AA8]|nr:NUDIX domain-containing protein [Streptomyces telluris]